MSQIRSSRAFGVKKKALVALAAFSLVAAACGGDDDAAPADEPTESDENTEESSEPADEPSEPAEESGEPADEPSEPAESADEPPADVDLGRSLVLASIEPMTGSNILTQYINGVKMAVEDINAAGGIGGYPIEFKEYDNKLDAQAAVSAAQLAVSDGADIVIGMPASITNNAAAAILQDAGIVYLNAGVSTQIALDEPLGHPRTFRIMTPMPELIYAMAQYTIDELQPPKVGLMGLNIDYGQNALPQFESEFTKAGIETTDARLYPFDVTDVTADILEMQGSDAIVDWSYPNQMALGIRTAIQNGLGEIPYIGGPSASIVNSRELVPAEAQKNLFGAQSCDPRTDSRDYVREWAQRYEEQFDEAPDYSSPSVYDAVFFVKLAVETAGTLDPEAIAAAMSEITLDEGTMCATSYHNDGRNQLSHEAVVMSFTDGVPTQQRQFTADDLEGHGLVQGG